MAAISFFCMISFVVGFYLSSNLISCSLPVRINSTISSDTCPSENVRSELNKVIEQELVKLYETPCKNTLSRPTRATSILGGKEGLAWDDIMPCYEPAVTGIRKINISYDSQVNSIQVTYLLADGTLYTAPRHGSYSGSTSSFILAKDERIVLLVAATNDSVITSLQFNSKNSGGFETQYGPFGEDTQGAMEVGGYILGFSGYSSSVLLGISVHFLQPLSRSTSSYGGSCTNNFYDDKVDTIIPPVVAINSIVIHHGSLIDSIQASYTLLGGSLYEGTRMGGLGGETRTVTLIDNEIINRMNGSSFEMFLGQLSFYSTFQGTHFNSYGPYGSDMENSFDVSGNILGFYGYTDYHSGIPGDALCSIGVYRL